MTDRIDILTKARDALTEHLYEVSGENFQVSIPPSSPLFDTSSPSPIHSQYSPTDRFSLQQRASMPSSPFSTKDMTIDHFSNINEPLTQQHSCPPISNGPHQHSSQSRSPSIIPNYFIRVHFPNKHTTAVS